MARFKKIVKQKHEGKIVYGEAIVHNIVALSVSELPYVELFHKDLNNGLNPSVNVYFDKKGVDVDIQVKVHFSQRVSETVFRIQEAVRHSIESMTEYHVLSVNVLVMAVVFEDMPLPITEEKNEYESISDDQEKQ